MLNNSPFQIVIIDDDTRFTSKPLFEELVELYGQENLIWKETPQEGLAFLQKNLTKRTIVILDYHLGDRMPTGLSWLKPLQEVSSLLYIILNTSHEVSRITPDELKDCINNHLMALVDKTDGYTKTLLEVEKAIGYLSNRVDCILEEWILRHEQFTREKPYIRNEKGETLNLNDILIEIRKDTEFGRKMSNNIISTAITLMQRDIDKLDNSKK